MIHFTMILFTAIFLFTSTAKAENAFHPSRVKLIIHGGIELNEDVHLLARFLPAGNLIGELAPYSYLGAKFQASEWLGIEAYTGWTFGNDEPLVSLTFSLKLGNAWMWTETDVQMPSLDGYVFVQLDYPLLDWLHAGFEGESWGNYKDSSSWSDGGGPNLLFRFEKVGMDIALHFRQLENSIKPEFIMRFHLFL